MASFLNLAISISMVFLLGCIGEIVTEKAGHLNLGIPGIMAMGSAGGCIGASIYMTAINGAEPSLILLIIIPIVFACLFAGIGGLIYAFLTISLRSNQNVVGLAITTFGTGFAQFFIERFANLDLLPRASRVIKQTLPFASKLGWFGKVFLEYGALSFIAVAVAIIIAILLRKTKVGLSLRAIGENPATADAVGINVTKYKYFAVIIGSMLAGFGGLYYVMDFGCGTWENADTIIAFGWLALALVIFTVWKPDLAVLGSIVFGVLYILPIKLNVPFDIMKILKGLPYVVTVLVLIITSILGKKNVQPPASLGVNYFREER